MDVVVCSCRFWFTVSTETFSRRVTYLVGSGGGRFPRNPRVHIRSISGVTCARRSAEWKYLSRINLSRFSRTQGEQGPTGIVGSCCVADHRGPSYRSSLLDFNSFPSDCVAPSSSIMFGRNDDFETCGVHLYVCLELQGKIVLFQDASLRPGSVNSGV